MAKSKLRQSNEINAGSMADIAFLLLIFFLVTTTIAEDKGILTKLPPWSDEPPPKLELNARNVYSILVNANNQLLVRGEPMDIKNLKENTKNFISNPGGAKNMAISPKSAIISLKNDRGTHYDTYLQVYNELQAAYRELRNEYSLKHFSKEYDKLPKSKRKIVKSEIPLVLSEAEPTAYGEEN